MISGMVYIKNGTGDEIARFDYKTVKGMVKMADGRTCIVFDVGDKMVVAWPYSSVIKQTNEQKGHIK